MPKAPRIKKTIHFDTPPKTLFESASTGLDARDAKASKSPSPSDILQFHKFKVIWIKSWDQLKLEQKFDLNEVIVDKCYCAVIKNLRLAKGGWFPDTGRSFTQTSKMWKQERINHDSKIFWQLEVFWRRIVSRDEGRKGVRNLIQRLQTWV